MRTLVITLASASTALALYACGSDTESSSTQTDASDGAVTTQNVELAFEARVGTEPFSCTRSYANVGTMGTTVEPLTFAFYVHDVQVKTVEGTTVPLTLTQDNKWQYQTTALLDFEDKTGSCANGTVDVNTRVVGNFQSASNRLSAISFKVGVPVALNHSDSATQPSPLNLSSMYWDWQGGYKFMRLDFRAPSEAGAAVTTLLHLGSTGCTGSTGAYTCTNPNVPTVTLNGAFDPQTNKIVLDYKNLVQGIDVNANAGGAPGCMSGVIDPECTPIFQRLGLDIATGNASTNDQSAFSIQ